MSKRARSYRTPTWLRCRDCGYEPQVKQTRRQCKVCGGFMRVKR